MPILSREERESANKASAQKNLKLRETRSNAREEKKAIKEKLQGVNNTSDKRAIKSGAIYDLSTNSYAAKKEFPETGKRPIQDNAVDFVGRDGAEEGEGGGLPSGFAEELLDVVNDDNTAGQRYFLTKAV